MKSEDEGIGRGGKEVDEGLSLTQTSMIKNSRENKVQESQKHSQYENASSS
jgi:hypothetical protein